MIATIKHLDEPQRAAFGFVPGAFTEEVERRWYRALLHSCKADSECDIGGHHLIEMGFWDQQKLAGMGASPSAPTGILVGIRVKDADTWSRVQRGEITKFELDFDAQGVEVRFPQPGRASAPLKKKRGITMCTNDENLPSSVAKALAEPESSSKQDFEVALDDLAESLRRDGETHEAAYARGLNTPIGKRLYSGFDASDSTS